MKKKEVVKKRIKEGVYPDYITTWGKYLWIDPEHYDNYSSASNCKILIDARGKFVCYSDNLRIKALNSEI